MQTKLRKQLVKKFSIAALVALGGFLIDELVIHIVVTLPATLLAVHYLEKYRSLRKGEKL